MKRRNIISVVPISVAHMTCSNCEMAWLLYLANATYDGDKESEGEEDGGGSPEDSRKVSLIFFYSSHSSSVYILNSVVFPLLIKLFIIFLTNQ